MGCDPRQRIGTTLHGDVLEIGPGHQPFPTAADARVTYADRSVEGGRDATWPELAGQPRGPDADVDVDLDTDGLAAIADAAFDVVIASHLIEHLANPLAALCEFERVLRPGGRLVLVVPDRTRTFDSVREPTTLAHLLDEFDRGVAHVDAQHIKEFCDAIYSQPPIHPDEVRQWHDPARLDDARLELHRRRSIHAHCWTAEEFAVAIAGGMARGLMSWRIDDLYFSEDAANQSGIEFGLVLHRPETPAPSAEGTADFIRDWTSRTLGTQGCEPHRVVALHAVLLRDLTGAGDGVVATATSIATEALGAQLATSRAEAVMLKDRLTAAEARFRELSDRIDITELRLTSLLNSRSYRLSRALSGPLRLIPRHR